MVTKKIFQAMVQANMPASCGYDNGCEEGVRRAEALVHQLCSAAAQEEAELAAEIAAGAEPIPGTPLPPAPTLDELLDEGLSRCQSKPTWKLWIWPVVGQDFYDADSFRCC